MRRRLALEGVARRRSARHARGDDGFTITELVVTIAILLVAMTLSTGFIIGFSNQTTDASDSVKALQQTSLAGQALVQYLRGATNILPESPSAATYPVTASLATSTTDLTLDTAEGFNTTTESSDSSTICAQWIAPSSPKGDAEFQVTYDCGTAQQTTVATYYALGTQTVPVFTYYKAVGGALTALPIDDPVPACALPEIAAIGVDITFLAGPQVPTEGFAADMPTTLDTTVYLRGAGLSATTTTTTSTTSPCSE